ncbi:hyaluronidase B-like [Anthonomus grandis grandis]|uniref:hyaluronidase B-like n=1 Tax=Anthonomus grandis grandis TaxID=2921223 RepID=UPI0021668B41|nr:hyaluronidase B-like [Anthonomus grandis grandis]
MESHSDDSVSSSDQFGTRKEPKEPLQIYWNVPSFQCDPFKLDFTTLLNKYNIIHNEDVRFRGDTITILYDPGDFPALLKKENGDFFFRNGGVPQEGNLTCHLEVLEQTIVELIPNEDYSGLAIIDFESWRPIFRQHWGNIEQYKHVSVDIEREKYPDWDQTLLKEEAVRRLEAAAKIFLEESLILAKKLRPNGKWGYYHYPYSYTDGSQDSVSQEVQSENDSLDWLWKASDAFYPSVYVRNWQSLEYQVKFIETTLEEVFRVKKKFNNDAGVFVYLTYIYGDSNTFIPKENMSAILATLARYDVDGVILWGASADVCSRDKCNQLYEYIDNVFGPSMISI